MNVHPLRRKEPDELLSIAEVVRELKISRNTFYRWRELHIGPKSIRLPNGEIRVPRSELNAWLDNLREDAA
jgi:predicted DNA-binding transcriptional regulator AlpA